MASILLVDDTRENLLALAAVLEPLGRELVLAESGREALRQLLTRDVAVILLDVQMPDMDGFETAELIKRRERTRHIPIVFLTAISKDESHVFRGYESGAVDYIFKPYEPEILRSKVRVFLDLHEKTEQLRRHEEAQRERELAELRQAEEQRYRELADAMPQIVWMADRSGRAIYYNRQWFEYTGLPQLPPDGGEWQRVVHADDLPGVLERRHETLETGEVFETQYRFRAADGSYRWHLGRAVPIRADDGSIDHWVGTATDIDEEKRLEQAERFLVEAGAVLGGSLDYRRTLADVARLAVPRIADWARIDVVDENGRLRLLQVAHVDPKKIDFVHELEQRYPPSDGTGPAKVVRTLEPELMEEIPDELLADAALDDLHLALLRELGLRSYMCVPLVVRGRGHGAITLVSAESGRSFSRADLALAEELARRAAIAIDNAELYREAEERAQAARALAAVGDGVFLVDRAGVIRLWNPAAAAVSGLAEADVLGRQAAEAIPGWEQLAPRIPLAPASEPAAARPQTLPLDTGSRELWLSISGVEVDDGTVYAFRDLTEERALEKLRSDFVATVSHELRTPLAAIYGAAMTIRRPDLELEPDVNDRLLQVIAEESDRLARIVNDLLLASSLDSDRVTIAIESCDARGIAESVVDAARAHLPENVTLDLLAEDELPPVAADTGQLHQVLVNLVDNAIKYSPEGGPVAVELSRARRHLRFAVRDEGVGIPRAEHERIFEKFYRLDPNMTRGVGGTGLGLYICRELVRRVEGRIWVESAEGQGSSFYVEIPLAEVRPRRATRRTAAA